MNHGMQHPLRPCVQGAVKLGGVFAVLGGMLLICSPGVKAADSVKIDKSMLAAFKPLPAVMESKDNPVTDAKVDLGRMLFYEKRLSKNHDISCNSCHGLNNYGVDGDRFSTGHQGHKGDRNAPTVYNAALHIAQFWDGRAKDVEAQAKGPILNPIEMAMPNEAYVINTLKSISGYVDAFERAFPGQADPLTYDNLAKAIGAFERKLLTPSPFDKFLQGDEAALTDAEKTGLKKFIQVGCSRCHKGTGVGGRLYRKLGQLKPWPNLKDEGRSVFTKNDAHRYFFKVPGLRNIEKTAPYLHDGSISRLDEMVRMMAEYQLDEKLSDEEVRSIVTFLEALTGESQADYIKEPELPDSGPGTPKPDPS